MEDEKNQKELFEFEPEKKAFPRLSQLLPKPDLDGKRTVTMTLEAVILLFMGIILALVIMFAFGVERGKTAKRAAPHTVAPQKAVQPIKAVVNTSAQSGAVDGSAPRFAPSATIKMAVVQTPSGTEVVSSKKGLAAKNPILNEMANPWTIVAVACKNKEIAVSEVIGLKRQGGDAVTSNAFIAQNGPYYLVCIGAYKTKASAQAALTVIRQKYKDAYLKLQ